jgi:hypothetical protein
LTQRDEKEVFFVGVAVLILKKNEQDENMRKKDDYNLKKDQRMRNIKISKRRRGIRR